MMPDMSDDASSKVLLLDEPDDESFRIPRKKMATTGKESQDDASILKSKLKIFSTIFDEDVKVMKAPQL